MRALIRNLDTGLLYKAPGQWVESPFEATAFGDDDSAHAAGMAMAETNLEIFFVDPAGKPIWGRRLEK